MHAGDVAKVSWAQLRCEQISPPPNVHISLSDLNWIHLTCPCNQGCAMVHAQMYGHAILLLSSHEFTHDGISFSSYSSSSSSSPLFFFFFFFLPSLISRLALNIHLAQGRISPQQSPPPPPRAATSSWRRRCGAFFHSSPYAPHLSPSATYSLAWPRVLLSRYVADGPLSPPDVHWQVTRRVLHGRRPHLPSAHRPLSLSFSLLFFFNLLFSSLSPSLSLSLSFSLLPLSFSLSHSYS